MDIWKSCDGARHIRPLNAIAYRVVESQEKVATTFLVDSSHKQSMLEDMIERRKPRPPEGWEKYHYLLWTPFRYPPLPYGSRFGSRNLNGIFYGSLAVETALAECAYYRLVLLDGMSVKPPVMVTQHTSFNLKIATASGVRLNEAPFSTHRKRISNPAAYSDSQHLGEAMRAMGVTAFTYYSARFSSGMNIGVFELGAIQSKKPDKYRQWVSKCTAATVDFNEIHGDQQTFSFAAADFRVNGMLPAPAMR
jgi:hypothetical protein